jgi:hypothetical protein
MPTVPNPITTPPTAPQRTDLATFVPRADAYVAWLESEADDIGQNATATYNNATEAAASATSAASAAASVGAALWVSGTSYSIGDVRRSPITYFAYRRLTNGAGTTDPSADATNWALAFAAAPAMQIVTGTSVNALAFGHYVLTNAAVTTVTLPASPAAGDMIWVSIANDRSDNIIANNTKNIMGLAANMIVDAANCTVQLRYADTTRGWRIM